MMDASEAVTPIERIGERMGVREEAHPSGWFTRAARYYFKRNFANRHKYASVLAASRSAPLHGAARNGAASATDQAHRAIFWACVKSAVTGALAGTASTGATLVTAETEGLAGFVAVPIAAAAIGGEMLYRSKLHIDLTCELAAIFGLEFDPSEPSHEQDLWRLYALAFGTHDHEDESDDPGKALVHDVSHVEGEEVGEKIGHAVLGESLMRNIVPFIGIVSSAVTNVVMTRKIGHTIRRYMRYRRAFKDAFAHACDMLEGHMDLLIEGLWFIFTADGKLEPEEAACLANLLHRVDPVMRNAITQRFVEDEHEWTERIVKEIPESLRDVFLHALEVAAAVDKEVSVPERKILRRASRKLGREFDMTRVDKMIRDFEEHGVLTVG
jgi:hypothetical protein